MFESVSAVEATDPTDLAGLLFAVDEDEIATMSLAESEAFAVAAQRVVSAATARQRSAMETVARRCEERCEIDATEATAVGRRTHHVSGQAIAAGSLAALLHVSPRTMSTRIDQARRVACALPGVHALAWSGDLEPYSVDAVVAESCAAPATRLHEFEARVLEGDATGLTCAALRRRARRRADRCAPLESAQGADLARARRDVRVRPGECTGMTRLVADLPTPVALRLWGAVDALAAEYARAKPGRTIGAARADALADLVEANATISTTIELVAPIDAECAREGGYRRSRGYGVSSQCLGPVAAAPEATYASPTDLDPRATDPSATDPRLTDESTPRPAGAGVHEDLGGCEELDDGVLHDHGGCLWFVSANTDVPVLGSLLPSDVVLLLTDPDVGLRLARSDSLTGAIRWQDPRAYRPGPPSAAPCAHGTGPVAFPGAPPPRGAVSSTTWSAIPTAPPSPATCRPSAPPTTGSSTMPAGGSRWIRSASARGPPPTDAVTRRGRSTATVSGRPEPSRSPGGTTGRRRSQRPGVRSRLSGSGPQAHRPSRARHTGPAGGPRRAPAGRGG